MNPWRKGENVLALSYLKALLIDAARCHFQPHPAAIVRSSLSLHGLAFKRTQDEKKKSQLHPQELKSGCSRSKTTYISAKNRGDRVFVLQKLKKNVLKNTLSATSKRLSGKNHGIKMQKKTELQRERLHCQLKMHGAAYVSGEEYLTCKFGGA